MSNLNVLFEQELNIVNIGVEVFSDAVSDQKFNVAHVEWKPPAGGDLELIEILDWLEV